MKTAAHVMNTSYSMLPVMVLQIRQNQFSLGHLRGFLHEATRELADRDQRFLQTRTRYFLQLRSRRERREIDPCFEAEEAALIHGRLALDALKGFIKTRRRTFLNEALYSFEASEWQFEQLLRLRMRLTPNQQEDLQRAA